MKPTHFRLIALLSIVVLWSCGQKDHHEGHDQAAEPVEQSGNAALDDQVMKIHNEVMPKMGELVSLKLELKKQIEETPTMAAEKKAELETTIAKLDSAYDGMMDWMSQYKPIADSTYGEEKAREYLEAEMEKIKKVRQDMLDAIDRAKGKQ